MNDNIENNNSEHSGEIDFFPLSNDNNNESGDFSKELLKSVEELNLGKFLKLDENLKEALSKALEELEFCEYHFFVIERVFMRNSEDEDIVLEVLRRLYQEELITNESLIFRSGSVFDFCFYNKGKKPFNKMARFFLEKGFDINERDYYNNTPLIRACMKKEFEMVKYLLDNNADITATNYCRKTAFDVAKEAFDVSQEMLELF